MAVNGSRPCGAFYNGAHMFVHLRLHTEFSVVDGTNRINAIVKAAAEDGQVALAVTDFNNLFGGVKFYREGRAKGVKPVLGAEIQINDTATTEIYTFPRSYRMPSSA